MPVVISLLTDSARVAHEVMMDKCIMTAAWWSTQTAQCRQIPLDFKYDIIKLKGNSNKL